MQLSSLKWLLYLLSCDIELPPIDFDMEQQPTDFDMELPPMAILLSFLEL